MTVAITFEAHSTSLDNETGLASGWFDVALSETGRAQARALGERHSHEPIDRVCCSDLQRAVETGAIAFAGRAVPIVRDARLRECNYGDLTRSPAAEIERQRLSRVDQPFPNGESYTQAAARIRVFLAELLRDHDGAHVLIIGHRATYYALEHLLNGTPLRAVITAPFAWQPGWHYTLGLPNHIAKEERSMTATDPAEPLLEKLTPEVRPLVHALRALILAVIPQVSESVHLGWSSIHYRTGERMRGVVVALLPQRAYVNLEFIDGIDLPDPAHRLEGTGKRLRHVKIRSNADVQHPEVRALLEAAARQRGL